MEIDSSIDGVDHIKLQQTKRKNIIIEANFSILIIFGNNVCTLNTTSGRKSCFVFPIICTRILINDCGKYFFPYLISLEKLEFIN